MAMVAIVLGIASAEVAPSVLSAVVREARHRIDLVQLSSVGLRDET